MERLKLNARKKLNKKALDRTRKEILQESANSFDVHGHNGSFNCGVSIFSEACI